MAIATSNRLLPLLAGAVVLMLAFVTLKSCTGEQEARLVMETVPQAPAPDADSPADTIKTLTANVAAMTTEVQALRKENNQLGKDNRDLLASRHQIEPPTPSRSAGRRTELVAPLAELLARTPSLDPPAARS